LFELELPTEDLARDLLVGEHDLDLGDLCRPGLEEDQLDGTSGGVQPREDLPELLLWLGVE
jgi:hypothetical protein